MKRALRSPLLWLLLIWFHGGDAYLRWVSPAILPSQGDYSYFVSPEIDPIITSYIIIAPLFLLCALPIVATFVALNEITNWIIAWFGYPPNYFQDITRNISPLISALAIYFFISSARREIKKIELKRSSQQSTRQQNASIDAHIE